MENKKFIYFILNRSGIGDRMMDIVLIYTFAKHIKANVYLNWCESEKMLMGDKTNINSILRYEKTLYRTEDFKYKNFINFIELPNDINLVSEFEIIKLSKLKDTIKFYDYLGMQFTPYTFIDKYQPNLSLEEKQLFYYTLMNNFKLIKFKNIPQIIVNLFINNKIITIHLRRSDKVVNTDTESNFCNGITINELENLDTITEKFCNYFISKGEKNILFVSDEKQVKLKYYEKFKDKCNAIIFNTDEISQTYIDLYCIAHASSILLSQKFSAFSLFASCINQNTLYYIYPHFILESYNHARHISTLNL
jgi:hypothetical protein